MHIDLMIDDLCGRVATAAHAYITAWPESASAAVQGVVSARKAVLERFHRMEAAIAAYDAFVSHLDRSVSGKQCMGCPRFTGSAFVEPKHGWASGSFCGHGATLYSAMLKAKKGLANDNADTEDDGPAATGGAGPI